MSSCAYVPTCSLDSSCISINCSSSVHTNAISVLTSCRPCWCIWHAKEAYYQWLNSPTRDAAAVGLSWQSWWQCFRVWHRWNVTHIYSPCWEVGDGVGVLHVLVMLMQLLVLHFVDMPSSVVKDCWGNQSHHIQHGYQQERQPATHTSFEHYSNWWTQPQLLKSTTNCYAVWDHRVWTSRRSKHVACSSVCCSVCLVLHEMPSRQRRVADVHFHVATCLKDAVARCTRHKARRLSNHDWSNASRR